MHVILMDATLATGAAAMMAIRILLVSLTAVSSSYSGLHWTQYLQ